MSEGRYPWIRARGGLHAIRAKPDFALQSALLIGGCLGSILLDAPPLSPSSPFASCSPFSQGARQEFLPQVLILAAIAAAFLAVLLADPPPTLAPLFRRRVGAETGSHGKALAERMPQLDHDAALLGVVRPSAFRLVQGPRGGAAVWHDPAAGLRTFLGLQAVVDLRGRPEDEELREDLRRLVQALERALDEDVGFCLVLLDPCTRGTDGPLGPGSFF